MMGFFNSEYLKVKGKAGMDEKLRPYLSCLHFTFDSHLAST